MRSEARQDHGGWPGLGVSVVSRATVAKEIKLGVLVAVPLEPRLIRTLSLVYPREKFRSKLITTFMEFATSRMKQIAAAAWSRTA